MPSAVWRNMVRGFWAYREDVKYCLPHPESELNHLKNDRQVKSEQTFIVLTLYSWFHYIHLNSRSLNMFFKRDCFQTSTPRNTFTMYFVGTFESQNQQTFFILFLFYVVGQVLLFEVLYASGFYVMHIIVFLQSLWLLSLHFFYEILFIFFACPSHIPLDSIFFFSLLFSHSYSPWMIFNLTISVSIILCWWFVHLHFCSTWNLWMAFPTLSTNLMGTQNLTEDQLELPISSFCLRWWHHHLVTKARNLEVFLDSFHYILSHVHSDIRLWQIYLSVCSQIYPILWVCLTTSLVEALIIKYLNHCNWLFTKTYKEWEDYKNLEKEFMEWVARKNDKNPLS